MSHAAAYQALVFFAVVVAAIAILGMGRVWLSVQATQASIDSAKLRQEIKSERYRGDLLEVQQSALATPSRILSIATDSLGMAPATSVTYLRLKADATAQAPQPAAAAGSNKVGGMLEKAMDIAAGEAQVLLVGDVGLTSSHRGRTGGNVAPKKRRRSPGSGRFTFILVLFSVLLLGIVTRLVWIQVVRPRPTRPRPSRSGCANWCCRRDVARSTTARVSRWRSASTPGPSTPPPNTIKDKAGTAAALASVLGGTPKDYEGKLAKDTGFVYIARAIDGEKAKTLEDLNIKGIGFLDDSRRMYPSSELACQVLGFVGNEGQGLAGIEKRYNKVLAGNGGVLVGERDPYGRPIPGGVQKTFEPVDGHDIVLTIDKDIQYHAQTELAAAVEKFGAKGGSVVVMNPSNGETYAMASTPGYEPQRIQGGRPGGLPQPTDLRRL